MLATAKTPGRFARAITTGPAAVQSWRALLALLVVVVGYLALTPYPPAGIDTGWDKLNHVLAFTALAFSASLSCPTSPGARRLLLCALLAYGGAIEIAQSFVPGRSAEWGDLLADALGIASGAVIAAVVVRVAATATLQSGRQARVG